MKQPNWDEAPKGATHVSGAGIFWRKEEGGRLSCFEGGSWVITDRVLSDFSPSWIIERPAPPPEPDWRNAPGWASVLLRNRNDASVTAWVASFEEKAKALSTSYNPGSEFRLDPRCWELISERPAQWRGQEDGLPPVGVTVLNKFGEERLVVAHDGDTVVCRCVAGSYQGYTKSEQAELRPIQTPEQIAAREREEAIEAMHAIYMRGALGHKGGLAALYDAGLRFPDQR